ncbi:hypothetical protein Syun_014831 [Stephania yunnanensis]|uniref:Uncharacterized protein n=1 Tax=Stephania yunnanensis TaxID=152371 RepID=A0AAP0JK20_9MAGN
MAPGVTASSRGGDDDAGCGRSWGQDRTCSAATPTTVRFQHQEVARRGERTTAADARNCSGSDSGTGRSGKRHCSGANLKWRGRRRRWLGSGAATGSVAAADSGAERQGGGGSSGVRQPRSGAAASSGVRQWVGAAAASVAAVASARRLRDSGIDGDASSTAAQSNCAVARCRTDRSLTRGAIR